MLVYAQQNDTLDAICWRYLRKTRGMVEKAIELNPAALEQGPILAHGTPVILPEINPEPVNVPVVRLWD
jgi:phage tail protein X